VNDVEVGSIIRAVRIRRGLRQSDVAAAAGISQPTVSLIEGGRLDRLSVAVVRRVAAAVGVSLPFAPRWRGPELARLLDEKHAAMVRGVVDYLSRLGWQPVPEHTFNLRGERGAVDVLAWHPVLRAVLIVEVKSQIVDLQDLLSSLDRKRRLGPALARELGWRPLVIGAVLVLPEETQARNAVRVHRSVLDAALPARTLEVRRWLRRPDLDMRGIWFLLNIAVVDTKRRAGGSRRVRPRRVPPLSQGPRSSRAIGGPESRLTAVTAGDLPT
jgi:transcriptional regulator with XRE-family HTH domain